MKRPLLAVARALMLAALLLCGSSTRAIRDDSQTPLAKLPPEVRLRKLHLVRPDLIQYPIDYEVYC